MEIGESGVSLKFLGHAGFFITSKEGKKIVIDPFKISESFKEKADIVLITHSHYDHCSIEDIEKLIEQGTVVVCTPDCQSKVLRFEGIQLELMEVGDNLELDNIKIEAVAAYNKHKEYHPKSEGWVGYIIRIGNVIIYHSGDTDFIPEMQKLSGHGKRDNEFVALLPVSGKYVMNAEQAVEAASLISPDLAVPMHYGEIVGTIEDAQNFVKLCGEKNINAKILERE